LDNSQPPGVAPISEAERLARLSRLRAAMDGQKVDAVLLGSSNALHYFTGLVWHQASRFCGALVTRDGLAYIVPAFERTRMEALPRLDGDVAEWQEDGSAAALISSLLGPADILAVDDALPLVQYHPLVRELGPERVVDGGRMIRDLRMLKSPAEIALMQHAMDITLQVHRSARAIIRPGIKASEVEKLIDAEHRWLGADDGSSFCIVSFGKATALPHGAPYDHTYRPGDVILVDTGCRVHGYPSDITRTYVLDEPHPEFARNWVIEREAEQAVFDAAKLGATCGSLDDAARAVIARYGMGPDYKLPGIPHRAGHGLGLDGHEDPFIVRGNGIRLAPGMCFSSEPMIVFPDRYGIRLEDIIFMTADGPRWFTKPALGPAQPFDEVLQ
jgi:Xaa-Pro dipeptidase